ncbi:MAG: hypothetical protein WCL50_10230 [Spirochaetota bacterium]
MLGFFLKKAFFDGWDNLLPLVLVNLAFLPIFSLLFIAGIQGLPVAVAVLFLALTWFAVSWWFAVASLVTIRWSDYKSFAFSELPAAMRAALVPSLQIAGLLGVVLLALGFGLPFYLSRGLGGALAAGVLFWGSLTGLLGLQFYLPLRFRLGGGFRKNIRKSFVILFDNPGFSLFVLAWSLLCFVLSAFLAFLAPGFAGLGLAQHDALKLRLRKYDWLEEVGVKSGDRKRRVPWKELLEEESELLGKRTLRGMIFPWKE